MINYKELCKELEYLIYDVKDTTANLANASALLNERLETINWCGFYLVKNNQLILGPFQGHPAHAVIEYGKGVCGTSWEKKETLVVKNVNEFEGYIMCDACCNAEIVVPIIINNEVFGVLDIDSPNLDRFTEDDKIGLEQIVEVLKKGIYL